MLWFKLATGSASRSQRQDPDSASTSPRFRVEPLEPRLLLSGDPLDLLKDAIEPRLVVEPAVVVEAPSVEPAPAIDWGASVDDDDVVITVAAANSEPLPAVPVHDSSHTVPADVV